MRGNLPEAAGVVELVVAVQEQEAAALAEAVVEEERALEVPAAEVGALAEARVLVAVEGLARAADQASLENG
jgi:hypothetical protein